MPGFDAGEVKIKMTINQGVIESIEGIKGLFAQSLVAQSHNPDMKLNTNFNHLHIICDRCRLDVEFCSCGDRRERLSRKYWGSVLFDEVMRRIGRAEKAEKREGKEREGKEK